MKSNGINKQERQPADNETACNFETVEDRDADISRVYGITTPFATIESGRRAMHSDTSRMLKAALR